MKVVNTNLWEATCDLIVVSTNSYITKSKTLVMGRGAAKEAILRYPLLSDMAGRRILNTCGHLGTYGFLDFGIVGLFQVKHHYGDAAKLELVRYSAIRLANYYLSIKAKYNKKLNIHMNYPAIGNGELLTKDVRPILEQILPESITLHMFEHDLNEGNYA